MQSVTVRTSLWQPYASDCMTRLFSLGLFVPTRCRESRFLSILLSIAFPMVCATNPALAAPPACYGATISLTPDDCYFIGSAGFADASGEAESGSLFCWLTNGLPLAAGPVAEDLLLHFDGTANGVNGETPILAQNLSYATGKWGSCLALPAGGRLQFSTTNNLHLDQGTIEMWVALRADGTNRVYSAQDHCLFQYW